MPSVILTLFFAVIFLTPYVYADSSLLSPMPAFMLESDAGDLTERPFVTTPQMDQLLKNLLSMDVVMNPGFGPADPRYNSAIYLGVFGDLLESFPGVVPLLQDLLGKPVKRKRVQQFAQEFITNHISSFGVPGIRPIFSDEIESFFKTDPEAQRFLKEVVRNDKSIQKEISEYKGMWGTLSEPLYFYLMSRGLIPILEAHDIFVHLPLMQRKEIQTQTLILSKLYNFYFTSPRKHHYKRKIKSLLEAIWYGLQESVVLPVRKSNGETHLLMTGGENVVGAYRMQYGDPNFFGLAEAFNERSAIDEFQNFKGYKKIINWLDELSPKTAGSISARLSTLIDRQFLVQKNFAPHEINKIGKRSIVDVWQDRQSFFAEKVRRSPEAMKLLNPENQYIFTGLVLELAQEAMGFHLETQKIMCPLF